MNTEKYYCMKWLAVIFMTTDHIAYFLQGTVDNITYLGLRTIGRLAFPLYAFMLAESFHFTKNKFRHLAKISTLAVISEIPYNLFVSGRLKDFRHQNVCFTLALGFVMMYIANLNMEKFFGKHIKNQKFRNLFIACIRINITAIFCLTSHLFNMDYGANGIVLIELFDTAKRSSYKKVWQAAAIILFICLNGNILYLICLTDLLIIYRLCSNTNKKSTATPLPQFITSKVSRTICGVFYPLHLMILALLMKNQYNIKEKLSCFLTEHSEKW